MEAYDIYQSFVSLNFYNFDVAPEDITKKLGIKPTETWLKGEVKRHKVGYTKFPRNTWTLRSSVAKDRPAREHLDELLELMRPHKTTIAALAKKYPSELWLALYADRYNPVVRLSPDLITALAEFHVTLSLDIYHVPPKV